MLFLQHYTYNLSNYRHVHPIMYKPLVTLFSVIIDYDDDYFKVGVGNSLFKKKIILPAYNPYVMM